MTDTIPAFAIVTQPVRSMFGKRTGKIAAILTGRYGANLYQVEAPTATQAKAELLQGVSEHLEHGERPSYIVCGDGKTVLVVFHTFAGWEYEIIDGSRHTASCCLMNCTSRKEAVQRAIAHADQSYGGTINVLRSV